jgi:predicted enzyme related to lactoylglutathione lyase
MKLTHVSLYVRNQDEAVVWFSEKLGFKKAADMPMNETSRWVTISRPEYPALEIVLEDETMAMDEAMAVDIRSRVGKSSTIVFEVSGIYQLVAELKAKGVQFAMDTFEFPWGTQAVFLDLYGNKFVLSQAPTGGYPTGASN